jgi:hypothetical protein
MVQTTSYDNLLETGTKVKFLKRGTKFSPQQTTRSTHLKQIPAAWYKSMNNITLPNPVNGTINDHHQHWLFQSTLYQYQVNSRLVTSSQTTPKELRMSSLHPSSINHHGKTECWEDIKNDFPWEIAESIWQGNAIVGTDGSAANDHGTYSFVILTDIMNESPMLSVKCGGNLPNLDEYIDMDSHCPEGAALFSALCIVRLLLTKYPRGPTTGVVPKASVCSQQQKHCRGWSRMDIRPRNLRVWLPQARLWPTPRYPMRNWNSPHGIKSQLGEMTSGPTQTKIWTFPSSKSQLHSRWRLHQNPSLTPKRSGTTTRLDSRNLGSPPT